MGAQVLEFCTLARETLFQKEGAKVKEGAPAEVQGGTVHWYSDLVNGKRRKREATYMPGLGSSKILLKLCLPQSPLKPINGPSLCLLPIHMRLGISQFLKLFL